MAIRTIYVGKRTASLWAAADRLAERKKISVSQLVTDALERHLPEVAAEPDPVDRWADIAADDAA